MVGLEIPASKSTGKSSRLLSVSSTTGSFLDSNALRDAAQRAKITWSSPILAVDTCFPNKLVTLQKDLLEIHDLNTRGLTSLPFHQPRQ